MKLATVALTCSSCDDYRLVEGEDGMLVRCVDCIGVTAVRCPSHGRSLVKGRCPECTYEAVAAEELLGLRGRPVLHPLAAAIQS